MSHTRVSMYHIHNTMMKYSVEKFLIICILFLSSGYAAAQADAGEDKAVCPTESVEIGTATDASWCYFWEDDKGNKSFPNTPKITVSPTETTKYTVTVTGVDFEFKDTDEVKVIVVDIKIKKLEFLSDHNLLRDATDPLVDGSRFPDVEWDKAAGRNAPITHTAADDKYIKIRLTLEIKGLDNTSTKIVGTSGESALNFEDTKSLSDGSDVTVELTAKDPIKHDIRIIENDIQWKVTIEKHDCDLEKTGPHKIFTTVGTPLVGEPGTTPNVRRMEIAMDYIKMTTEYRNYPICYPRLIKQLNDNGGAYNLSTNLTVPNPVRAWLFPTTLPAGADCISISTFFKFICKVLGVPGSFAANTYMAYYRTAADPVRPNKALLGGLSSPFIKPGDKGPTVTAGLDPSLILGLADQNCRGPAGRGEAGCTGGLNAFEAALEYTYGGITWYIPGGTDLIYRDKNHVVQIFQTLAWVGTWDHDSDPSTPNAFAVKVVDFRYTAPPSAPITCP